MANTSISNNNQFFIQGDGISTTSSISLGFTPSAASFVSASQFGGGDVSSNVSSAILSGSNINVTFVSPFSYLVAIVMNCTYAGGITAVTGTFWQATQPISGAVSFTAPQHVINDASAAVIGHVIADSGSTTVVTGNVTVVQPTGTNLHVVNDASSAVIGHVITDAGSVSAVTQTTTPWVILPEPSTLAAASCTVKGFPALNTANVKTSTGNVYGCSIANKASLIIYLQFYNTAGTPTLGTGVLWWIPIASGASLQIPPGTFAMGNFTTGIGIGVATSATGSGVPPVAPDVVVWYV